MMCLLVLRFVAAVTACAINLGVLSTIAMIMFVCRAMMQFLTILPFSQIIAGGIDRCIDGLIRLHSSNLRLILTRISGVRLACQLPEKLSQDRSYIMVVNHRSHVDILVILAVFYDKISDVKFFLKSSLFWVPFMGQFCYLMNYVFVKRIQPHQVRRDPSIMKRQRDLIRKQCRELTQQPVTLAVFAEGTRFHASKSASKNTNFLHLLSPQPAGIALALEASSPGIKDFLDVTLAYDIGFVSVWLLLSGQVKTVEIHAELHDVSTAKLVGDYVNDRQYRKRFTGWVRCLWTKKDALLSRIYLRFSSINTRDIIR